MNNSPEEGGITKECCYRTRETILLGSGKLDYSSCSLAGEGIMVNPAQCDECGIEALQRRLDCRHMRPQKRFLSGGRSQEFVSCVVKNVVLDRRRSLCAMCSVKEPV
jgi:hypothetical protein